ncbi:hypothetical protein LTS18_013774, partial [Coniosporium uncinatum]
MAAEPLVAIAPAAGNHTHIVDLPEFPAPKSTKDIDATAVVQQWLHNFEEVLSVGDASRLREVLHEECWWRDALALTWDLRTLHGLDKVRGMLDGKLEKLAFSNLQIRSTPHITPKLSTLSHSLQWVESLFTFDTTIGRGRGFIRLTQDEQGAWKAYMVYTALYDIKGHEEAAGQNRPHGGKNQLEGGIIKGNWFERRERAKEFLDDEPTVLVV